MVIPGTQYTGHSLEIAVLVVLSFVMTWQNS